MMLYGFFEMHIQQVHLCPDLDEAKGSFAKAAQYYEQASALTGQTVAIKKIPFGTQKGVNFTVLREIKLPKASEDISSCCRVIKASKNQPKRSRRRRNRCSSSSTAHRWAFSCCARTSPRDVQCLLVRCIARELLTCLVMQPVMNFASPDKDHVSSSLLFLSMLPVAIGTKKQALPFAISMQLV
ncbi:cyclin-dependent kinase 15 [Striga asiatica]|uniref:Cyclin-dependent kinase 15 n=1 Tax=Striga asiatica TaxID=4170 RepID=A0A5A7QX60_STRAF|nr:cyclin-dependent kinase 15 [Striga asiatica]